MNTIRRYAADYPHVIFGTAYDEGLGDQLRVTVIATGLSKVGSRRTEPPNQPRAPATAPLSVVSASLHREAKPLHGLRTGTDNLPVLKLVAQPAVAAPGSGHTATAPSPDGMNTPSVRRSARSQAAAKVDAHQIAAAFAGVLPAVLAAVVPAVFSTHSAQAAGDDDFAIGRQRFVDGVQAFFYRVVDEAAGVDDDEVGALEGVADFVALGTQLHEDQFRIRQSLRAPRLAKPTADARTLAAAAAMPRRVRATRFCRLRAPLQAASRRLGALAHWFNSGVAPRADRQ